MKPARITIRLGETEHEGDLDHYAADVTSSGGRVISRRVLPERYDDDGDVEDYETGEIELEVPFDKISEFAAKFAKTDAGRMAAGENAGAFFEKRLKAAAAPPKDAPPPAKEEPVTAEQRAEARARAAEHERLYKEHRAKLMDLGGLFKAKADGRGDEAQMHLTASDAHYAAAMKNKIAASEAPLLGTGRRPTIAEAKAASEKAHQASKPPSSTPTKQIAAPKQNDQALAKFAQAKKLPGALQTGARGGQYYEGPGGKKVYVKKG